MKKILLGILAILLATANSMQAQAVWDGNAETGWYNPAETDFTITTAGQLAGLAQLVNAGNTFSGKTVRLGADILLNDTTGHKQWDDNSSTLNQWTPIGSYAANDPQKTFKGTFDGQRHGVYGIYTSTGNDYQGLFGYVGAGGTVCNTAIGASRILGGDYAGGIAGYNAGNITACRNSNAGGQDSDVPLPEKVYVQIKFDLHDTQGRLYSSNYSRGVSLLEYQYNDKSGELIKGVGYNYPEGYWFPYGFIVKYGGGQGASNERIAKYDSGIDYYVGHENLWTTPLTGGQTTMSVYFIFAFQTGAHYDRNTLNLTIPWDEYDPVRHTDKALFYIEVNDKNWSVTFDGFEARKPTDNPAKIAGNSHSGGIAGYNAGTITSCYSTGAIDGNEHTGGITGRNAGTLEHCYYLTGTAAGGNDGYDMATQAEAYTPEQLASGEITWQLQHAMASPAWGQTIGTDSYPLWQDAGNKVYRLHLQDGETADNRYGNNGTAITLPAPERTGYTAQWYTAQNGGKAVQGEAILTEDMTLYARWTANTYTVTFDPNTDEAQGSMEPQAFTYDIAQPLAANNYTRTGCDFAGWAGQNTGMKAYDDRQEVINLTAENNGNVTLYAVWTAKKCTVTLNVADGCRHMGSVLGDGIYDYGTEADIKAAANEGYTFVQWSDGDTNARRTITVTEDIALTATFAPESTTGLDATATHLFRAIGTHGSLQITGTEAPAIVYDARGRIAYCGTARNIQLPPGMYIVRVADQVQKVMVK